MQKFTVKVEFVLDEAKDHRLTSTRSYSGSLMPSAQKLKADINKTAEDMIAYAKLK